MNDLVCISHLRWDFVWQRPQHLLSRLAKHFRVLFVEEPLARPDLSVPSLEVFSAKGASNINVLRLLYPAPEHAWFGHGHPTTQARYSRWLLRYLEMNSYKDPVLWLYTPMASMFASIIEHKLLIVDVMDQLSAFKGAPVELAAFEQVLLPRADLVFTGGVSLYRSKLPMNKRTHLFASGVDTVHFARAADRTQVNCPPEMAAIRGPILGYFGVIDERIDIPLLAHIADARPDWSLVMVGPIVKIDPNDLPQGQNIHYLGMRGYEQLPDYLAYFDAALIPFAANEATRYLSPTKTLEYMAGRKPVISTPISDVIELYGEAVRVGHTPDDFVRAIEMALSEPPEARRAIEDRLLARHAWDDIARRMNQIIQVQIERKTAAQQAVPSEMRLAPSSSAAASATVPSASGAAKSASRTA